MRRFPQAHWTVWAQEIIACLCVFTLPFIIVIIAVAFGAAE